MWRVWIVAVGGGGEVPHWSVPQLLLHLTLRLLRPLTNGIHSHAHTHTHSLTYTHRHIIAVGLEDGTITLHTCPTPSHTAHSTDFWSPLLTLSPAHCHTSTVKRLCWRPFKITDNEQEVNKMMYLASCSTDHCVKIFTIFLNEC